MLLIANRLPHAQKEADPGLPQNWIELREPELYYTIAYTPLMVGRSQTVAYVSTHRLLMFDMVR